MENKTQSKGPLSCIFLQRIGEFGPLLSMALVLFPLFLFLVGPQYNKLMHLVFFFTKFLFGQFKFYEAKDQVH